jgi:WD40 repeat protein
MEGTSSASRKVVLRSSEEESKATGPQRLLTVSSLGAIFYRLENGAGATAASLVEEKSFASYPHAVLGKFAPYSGRLAVIADPIGLHVVDCATGKELRLILKSTPISAMSFSPRDSYLITCEKFVAGEKNLIVWDIATGREVGQFEWKKGSREGTKSIKFTEDEGFCARISSKQ